MKPGGQNSGGAWWFAVIAFGLLVAWLGWRPEPASLPVLQVSSASTFSPPIRVNLTPTPARQISLEIDGDYIVRPVGSSLVLGHGGRTGPITVTPTATGLRIGEQTY